MIDLAVLFVLLRAILQTLSLLLGGIGIVAFYGSFRHADAAVCALVLLPLASGIVLLMPRPARS